MVHENCWKLWQIVLIVLAVLSVVWLVCDYMAVRNAVQELINFANQIGSMLAPHSSGAGSA